MKHIHIYIAILMIFGLGIILGARWYVEHVKCENTMAVCKIVFDTFSDENLKTYKDGYLIGPDGLHGQLVLTEEKDGLLHIYDAKPGNGTIVDAWGGAIYVVKYGEGIRVRSNGPDGKPNTGDDIEYK